MCQVTPQVSSLGSGEGRNEREPTRVGRMVAKFGCRQAVPAVTVVTAKKQLKRGNGSSLKSRTVALSSVSSL